MLWLATVAENTRVLLSEEGLAGELAIVFCISFVFVTSVLMLASKSVLKLATGKSTGNSEHEEYEHDGELHATGARFRGQKHHIDASTPSTPQLEGLRRRSSRNSCTSEDEAFRSSCGSLDSLTLLSHSSSCDSFGLVRNVSDTSLWSIIEDSDFHPVCAHQESDHLKRSHTLPGACSAHNGLHLTVWQVGQWRHAASPLSRAATPSSYTDSDGKEYK
jgi:hypothetical protein